MSKRTLSSAVFVALFAVAFAGAPPEAEVQGLYEGTCKDAKGGHKIEARVIALGKQAYKVYIRQDLGEGKLAKVVLDGKTEADAVTFAGKEGDADWKASYADGAIKGTCGEPGALEPTRFELKRVERKPPTLGAPPPEGALALLDGKTFTEMVRSGGREWYVGDKSKDGWAVWEVPLRTVVAREPAQWPDKDNVLPEGWVLSKERRRVDSVLGIGDDGSIQVPPHGGMNSRRQFDVSFRLHVEFRCPFMPDGRSQGRGNSGVYLPNGQEIQVLDSFGMDTYKGGGCGGLYGHKDPDTMELIQPASGKPYTFSLASLPPLAWQTYDIEYRVEKKDGKPVGKPRLTVHHNGITIHDNVELKGDARKGGFHFQDHGCPVRYRNIWVLPLEEK